MLIMCYACKSNSSNNIIGVMPYLPYSAQSKCIVNAAAGRRKAMFCLSTGSNKSCTVGIQNSKITNISHALCRGGLQRYNVIHTTTYYLHSFRDINNSVMEMLIMAYACKTSTARRIVGVIPYLPYSRQCKLLVIHLEFV